MMKRMPVRTILVPILICALVLATPLFTGATLRGEVRTTASISGEVFLDANHSGTRDRQEAGVEGAVTTLYAEDGRLLQTKISDSEGYYVFDSVGEGVYQVRVQPPAGYLVITNGSVTVRIGEVQAPELVSTGLGYAYGLYIPIITQVATVR